jgi:hypothetical protein
VSSQQQLVSDGPISLHANGHKVGAWSQHDLIIIDNSASRQHRGASETRGTLSGFEAIPGEVSLDSLGDRASVALSYMRSGTLYELEGLLVAGRQFLGGEPRPTTFR